MLRDLFNSRYISWSFFGAATVRGFLGRTVTFLAILLMFQISAGASGSSASTSSTAKIARAQGSGDQQSAGVWSDAATDQSLSEAARPQLRGEPPACQTPTGTAFHECVVDEGSKDVVIGTAAKEAKCQGEVVLHAGSHRAGKITISAGGTLVLNDEAAQDFHLTTTGIEISGGSLLIGNAGCPIGTINATHKVTIRFTGAKPSNCGALDLHNMSCPGYVKGIQVDAGGTLRMYGLKGVKGVASDGVNWTYLSRPAGDNLKFSAKAGVLAPPLKGPFIIYTAAPVHAGKKAWRPNDWIAIATTSFSPWETEFVQIDTVGPDIDNEGAKGSRITLKQDLEFYHFGGADPGDPAADANYNAGAATNYGVDERAEVGLISRNILLTSDSDERGTTTHWGGELKFLNGFQAVALQGVELQKFGKEQLGSYPIHFHLDGDLSGKPAADVLIDSNSIDHSYNKCITTHSTSNVSYTNNVCARITGHIFYEEVGDEANVTFNGNLGMGAMSNSFDVNATGTIVNESRESLIDKYYWVGDHMFTAPISVSRDTDFDQFKLFNSDNQYNLQKGTTSSFITTRGNCGSFDGNGKFASSGLPDNDKPITCYPGNPLPNKVVYFEPPSGFWILNPSAKLVGNSIAGCQDTGAAYWYIPPPDGNINAVKFIPIGPAYPNPHGVFQNNRGHGCYRGLNDDQFEVSTGDQISGYQTGIKNATNHPLVNEFDGVTVSRIRDRAIWLRPSFYLVKDGRMATNRRSISFVTSGGADGNYPGVWSLLSHSTIVGLSTNNVDRFGPCGSKIPDVGRQLRGGEFGCIDQTVPISGSATGGEYLERGYPNPDWNMFGFMSYDGPPLIVKDRFVNFLVNPLTVMTDADNKVIKKWNFVNNYKHYEGDAAIGWLDSNQSAYPTAATSKSLTFTNVDFRHQAFTDKVNVGSFNDGDKNTSIIDLDGTLSGYAVGDASGNPVAGAFPISLNNLPINASSNSVDECKATGQQDIDLEGRATAAMVPSGIGQLEFEAQYPINMPSPNPWPPNDHTQGLSFYKDTLDFGEHGSMLLHSRNGLGIWEPKVTSGYGYVVRADPFKVGGATSGAGIPALVDLGIVDTVKPKISPATPFYVQLGICYSSMDGSHPANASLFTVTHGYKSWAGGGVEPGDLALRQYFNQLTQLSDVQQWCQNLDYQQPNNLGANGFTGCPADGVALKTGTCPAGTTELIDRQGQSACLFPKNTPQLTAATSIKGMTAGGMLNGPPNLDKYFYDPATGMLYMWIAQTDPNAVGPSPLGNCTGSSSDPAFCPQNETGISTGEAYYNCPAEGCPIYRIVLNDPSYMPGPSTCPVFGSTGDAKGWANGAGGVTWPGPPANQPTLVYKGTKTVVSRTAPTPNPLPHYVAASDPTCN